MSGALLLRGDGCPEGPRFACVDPAARYTAPQVCQFKFSATLAPYPSEEAARAALVAAGAERIEEVRR
jgi:hypothetical protein